MTNRHWRRRRVRYLDETFEEREGDIIERNGMLTLVEDAVTHEPKWLYPFELEVRHETANNQA